MGWLLRLAIYSLIVGSLLFFWSCDFGGLPPWRALCHVVAGPPPSSPLEMRIVPSWYELPFVAVLRSVTINIGPLHAKELGLTLLALVLLAPLVLVFTNWSRTPGRAWISLSAAFAALIGLAWCGAHLPTPFLTNVSAALVALYLVTFLVVFPALTRRPAQSPAAPSN
jgi:quinol-cytochrome oxidoreductase complex cytochrome b subunit